MHTLLDVALSNAVMAVVLALLAAVFGVFCRRPAFVHGLWLLVLLKLLTPPLFHVPIPSFRAWEPAEPVAALADHPEPTEQPADVPAEGEWMLVPVEPVEVVPTATMVQAPELPAASGAPLEWIAPLLMSLWSGGSVLWLTIACCRMRRFQRLLRHAEPAPNDLENQAKELATLLGLKRCPPVRLVPGTVSPMLWSLFGSPRLLLPRGLLQRLDDAQRATLLVHELAHLARRDHCVRLLELLATALYWWHPAVWWARRELREAEEQCCDAWVIWALPGSAKAYATALVETVDFLSDACPLLPPVASGMGQVRFLKRRLTMIMQGTTPRLLSVAGLLAVLALGGVLLPLAPTWVQAEPPAPGRTREEEVKERIISLEDTIAVQRAPEVEKAMQDIRSAAEEVERLRAQLKAAEECLKAAIKRFGGKDVKVLVSGREIALRVEQLQPAAVENITLRVHPAKIENQDAGALRAQVKIKEAQVVEAEARLKQGIDKLNRVRQLGAQAAVPVAEIEQAASEVVILKAQLQVRAAEVEEAKACLKAAETRPMEPVKGNIGYYTRAVWPAALPAPPAATSDSERRMQDLEKKLGDLLREVEGLRKDLRKPRDPKAPPAPPTPPAPGAAGSAVFPAPVTLAAVVPAASAPR